MPKFYCDYCDVFLTHDSQAGRKQHNHGRRHQENVRHFYTTFLANNVQVPNAKYPLTFAPIPGAGDSSSEAPGGPPKPGSAPGGPPMGARPPIVIGGPGAVRPPFPGAPPMGFFPPPNLPGMQRPQPPRPQMPPRPSPSSSGLPPQPPSGGGKPMINSARMQMIMQQGGTAR